MLLRPSDTFLIEFHVQHGSSHNDGMYKTRKFHAVRTRICTLAVNDVIIEVRCLFFVWDLDLYCCLAIIGAIWNEC